MTTSGLTATVTALDGATVYYWRVKPVNYIGEGAASVRSFTTVTTLLAAPQLTSPADNTTNLPNQYTFTWQPVAGATGYHFEMCRAVANWSPTPWPWDTQSGSETSYFHNFNGDYSVAFYWRVASRNALGLGPYSAQRTVTTGPHPTGIDITSGYTVNAQGHPVLTWISYGIPSGYFSVWRNYCANIDDECWPWSVVTSNLSGPSGTYTDVSAWVESKTADQNAYYYYQIRNGSYTSNSVGFKVAEMLDKRAVVPTETKLSDAYPNPFNPQTTIDYSLADPAFVTITVYNMLGQKIEDLVTGQKPMGAYTLHWDGADKPTGIYVVRMTVNDGFGKVSYSGLKKLMLVR